MTVQRIYMVNADGITISHQLNTVGDAIPDGWQPVPAGLSEYLDLYFDGSTLTEDKPQALIDQENEDEAESASMQSDLLDVLQNFPYAQVDTYINNNVTNLPQARAFLKKLTKVVLYLVKLHGAG